MRTDTTAWLALGKGSPVIADLVQASGGEVCTLIDRRESDWVMALANIITHRSGNDARSQSDTRMQKHLAATSTPSRGTHVRKSRRVS